MASALAAMEQAIRKSADAASTGPAVVEALQTLIGQPGTADALLLPADAVPNEQTFCLSSGEPSVPQGRQLQQAQPFWDTWERKLRDVSAVLQATPAELVQSSVAELCQPISTQPSTLIQGGTLIQELPSTAEPSQQQPPALPVLQLLLIGSLYAPAAGLKAPWANTGLSTAAGQLMLVLSQQSSSGDGSKAQQQLLMAGFKPACRYWRAYLMCQPKTEKDRLEPYAGMPFASPRA